MKKFVTLLLAMTVTVVSAFAQIASGTADECKWTITDGGELIIEPSNGTTTIGTLPDGVYVIDGKKVIVK